MEDVLGIYGRLGLFEACTCVSSVVGYLILLRSLVADLNAWTVVYV